MILWVEEFRLTQLRLVVYPIICRVLYIPGGAGFCPSTVFHCFLATFCIWFCCPQDLLSSILKPQGEVLQLGTRLASTTFPTFMGEIAFKGRGFRDVQRTGPGGPVQAPETRETTSK